MESDATIIFDNEHQSQASITNSAQTASFR